MLTGRGFGALFYRPENDSLDREYSSNPGIVQSDLAINVDLYMQSQMAEEEEVRLYSSNLSN